MAFALVLVKNITYRGANEEFSNRYCMSGSAPSDEAAWRLKASEVADEEQNCFSDNVNFVRAYGYDDTNVASHAVWSDNFDGSALPVQSGITALSSLDHMPGDCAVWVRWKLDKLNSRGKSVYLRKYFHIALQDPSFPDRVDSNQKNNLEAFGTFMRGGTGGISTPICAPDGTLTVGSKAGDFITTRTLKRRGKRPPT